MCINTLLGCECGESQANIMNKNNILPIEVVDALYCPKCSERVDFDPERMVLDNGWVVAFDMELAAKHLARCHVHLPELSPAAIFDEGYSSWNGFTPTELQDSYEDKQKLSDLGKSDVRAYMEALKDWGKNRSQHLKAEGWRKARHI
jgi:hypothetical protein